VVVDVVVVLMTDVVLVVMPAAAVAAAWHRECGFDFVPRTATGTLQ
jgi:hypothetical protein